VDGRDEPGHDSCLGFVMASLERVPDRLSWSGFRLGLRRGLPVTPGIMAFGFVVGAAAARQGLSFFQSLAMNFLVCSGIA
jgi:predicted branched-subunit amino acid permease